MRHLSRSISDVRRALLEAAGLPLRIDCLIDQRVTLTIASPPDGPYREAPLKRIEGTVSGLTFDTMLETRPRLRLYVSSAVHGDVQAWFIEGAWYLDEPDMNPRPIVLEFPDDPLLVIDRILAASCPEWKEEHKIFMAGRQSEAFLDHLGSCHSCIRAHDKVFTLYHEDLSLDLMPQPPTVPKI